MWSILEILIFCCSLNLISGEVITKTPWQLPTAEEMQQTLASCRMKAAGEDASTLHCLVEQLGLWTDEQGYHAKRIAKIFAAHKQMEELITVINYCNERERRQEQPAQWAYQAYKCATSGRFGRWVKEYMEQNFN